MSDEMAFSAEEKALLVGRIKLYFREELDQEIGQFDAEFLLDFFAGEVGVYWFNRGVDAARQLIEERTQDIGDALYELERPTEFRR